MNHSLGIVIESLVAVLLMLTIGYCMVLNSRLKRLKADEHSLKATIGELITVRDVNEHLGSQLTAASQMSAHLKNQLAEGDGIIRRLTKIATAARPSGHEVAPEPAAAAPKVSAAKAVAAAAQAFSERRRTDGLAA
jgi:hypothetical protein